MQQLVKGLNQVSIEDSECRGGLAIYLGQGSGDTTRWAFEVWAQTGDGLLLVGKFATCPSHDGSPRTRLVATAAIPGAVSFTVKVRPAKQDAAASIKWAGSVYLSVGEPGGQLPGVLRVGERPKYYAGSAAALLQLPAGERVVAWSAFSTGAVASVVINGGDTITIPPSGGVQGGDGGLLEGPLQFAFLGANFGGYLVEVAESA
jgi:hypothetical protein